MTERINLKPCHTTITFEFADDGLFVYSGCCGVRLKRRKAKRLKRALKKWLAHP